MPLSRPAPRPRLVCRARAGDRLAADPHEVAEVVEESVHGRVIGDVVRTCGRKLSIDGWGSLR
jgi:hypothetical protein